MLNVPLLSPKPIYPPQAPANPQGAAAYVGIK